MTNPMIMNWTEFAAHTLLLHWMAAFMVVSVVAVLVRQLKRANATTRHNIWLIALVSIALMPLLVFAPKPAPSFVSVLERVSTSEVSRDAGVSSESTHVSPRTERRDVFLDSQTEVTLSTPTTRWVDTDRTILRWVLGLVLVVWLFGIAMLVWRLVGDYRATHTLKRQSDAVGDCLQHRFMRLCQRLDIAPVPLRYHAGISAPMTVGVRHLWVAIPMHWRESLDIDVFDQTLTHELGHIARKDPLIHCLQRLVCVLFWVYPAVWYVARQMEVERESACDDWVLAHDGKKSSYATNLLDVAEAVYTEPRVLAVGCVRSPSQLNRRIRHLLNTSSDHQLHSSWKTLAATTTVLAITVGASAVVWPDARQLSPPAETSAPTAPPSPAAAPESLPAPAPTPLGLSSPAAAIVPPSAPAEPPSLAAAITQSSDEALRPHKSDPLTLSSSGLLSPDEALMLAVQQRDVGSVVGLLDQGASIGEGALVLAIQQRDTRIVKALLRAQAEVSDGAVVMATQQGSVTLLKTLLDANPSLSSGPLIIAVQRQVPEMVRLLINAGAKVTTQVVMLAKQTGNADVLNLLEHAMPSGSVTGTAQDGEATLDRAPSSHSGVFTFDRWPVAFNKISMAFGEKGRRADKQNKVHRGIDFPMPLGSEIVAVASGRITRAAYNEKYGHYVVIDHGAGVESRYANNRSNQVQQGEWVNAGDKIAIVGNSSIGSTGPHLHFELRVSGTRVDPQLHYSHSN
ncbi:MAG: M56 family metallopeptidase [Pseudomonadota bacterium]